MGSAAATVESVRLDPEMKRALLLRAAADCTSASETIRRAARTSRPADRPGLGAWSRRAAERPGARFHEVTERVQTLATRRNTGGTNSPAQGGTR